MNKRCAGITLPQVLIAVAIVIILSAVALTAFGPQIRRQAHEGQIRRDLQAWIIAINIYKNDNDNLLPPDIKSLPRSGQVPERAPATLTVMSPTGPISGPLYLMATSQRQIDNEELQGRLIRWDAERYPIVFLNYYTRPDRVRYSDLLIPRPRENWRAEGFHLQQMRWKQDEFLSAFLSGRIAWSYQPDEYRLSSSMYNTFLGR